MKTISVRMLAALALGLAGTAASAQTPQAVLSIEQRLTDARDAKDPSTAVHLWTSLAEDGVAEAQYHVGTDLSNCGQDARGAAWLLKAANQDYTEAEVALGRLFTTSSAFQNTPDHEGAGEAWLESAAAKDNAEAEYWLGNANLGGSFESSSKAAFWFEKAASRGRGDAAAMLGHLYASGQGVVRDMAKSAYWNLKAAEAGDRSAQFEMGRSFETGQGTRKDYVQAYKWYTLATDSGETGGDVDGVTDSIAAKMTHAQIVEARAQIDAFRKAHSPSMRLRPPVAMARPCPTYPDPAP